MGMNVRMRLNDESPEAPLHGSDVCAIVVAYHPDAALAARLSRIAPQVGAIVIVDNGSSDAEVRMLHDIAADPKIHLTLNRQNLGVARALNLGIQCAGSLGYSLALLLDQDTSVEADMVHTLVGIYSSFPDRERLAVIGSNYQDVNRPSAEANGPESTDAAWDEAESVITSGSLLPLAAHAAIGPIHLSRVSGPIRFAKIGVATAAPSCVAAISRPAATGPPPSLAA